jgi:hypothetical protein
MHKHARTRARGANCSLSMWFVARKELFFFCDDSCTHATAQALDLLSTQDI